jgi:hypothetical protein
LNALLTTHMAPELEFLQAKWAAANQQYEQNGRRDLPTLDSVRKLSRINMADASAVMKEWRRLQTASAATAVVPVPDRVQRAAGTAVAALWAEAQELANDSLHLAQAAWDTERAAADQQRAELSAAFDAQGTELDSLRTQITALHDAALHAAAAADRERQEAQVELAALTEAVREALSREMSQKTWEWSPLLQPLGRIAKGRPCPARCQRASPPG